MVDLCRVFSTICVCWSSGFVLIKAHHVLFCFFCVHLDALSASCAVVHVGVL